MTKDREDENLALKSLSSLLVFLLPPITFKRKRRDAGFFQTCCTYKCLQM